MPKRIAFIGDSFVEGVGDDVGGGWTHRFCALQPGCQCTHKGIGGNNIRDILNRLPTDALLHRPDMIVVQIGANDSRTRESLGNLKEVPEAEFRAALLTLDGIVKTCCVEHLVVVGLCPVDESRTTPFKEDKWYYNNDIKVYDRILEKFASAHSHTFVPLLRVFGNRVATLTIDGLHPSPQGHALIAEKVSGSLSRLV